MSFPFLLHDKTPLLRHLHWSGNSHRQIQVYIRIYHKSIFHHYGNLLHRIDHCLFVCPPHIRKTGLVIWVKNICYRLYGPQGFKKRSAWYNTKITFEPLVAFTNSTNERSLQTTFRSIRNFVSTAVACLAFVVEIYFVLTKLKETNSFISNLICLFYTCVFVNM